jgi:hypothetical protein
MRVYLRRKLDIQSIISACIVNYSVGNYKGSFLDWVERLPSLKKC